MFNINNKLTKYILLAILILSPPTAGVIFGEEKSPQSEKNLSYIGVVRGHHGGYHTRGYGYGSSGGVSFGAYSYPRSYVYRGYSYGPNYYYRPYNYDYYPYAFPYYDRGGDVQIYYYYR